MAASSMMNKFARKVPPPPSEEEGEPSEDVPRGVGVGAGSAGEPDAGDEAASDLSDILGVGPEDREDFAAALKAYVHSCIESAMGDESGGEPVEGESEGEAPMAPGAAGPAYGA